VIEILKKPKWILFIVLEIVCWSALVFSLVCKGVFDQQTMDRISEMSFLCGFVFVPICAMPFLVEVDKDDKPIYEEREWFD